MDIALVLRLNGLALCISCAGEGPLSLATKLLVATRNAGKLHELRQILSDLPFEFIDLTFFSSIRDVAETGVTFVENAKIKATGYATQAKVLTLADDSGLEIDALGGAPGVFSARYLGESVPFPKRIESVITRLSGIGPLKRTARFVCAIAMADHEGNILNTSIGTCEGRIAGAPRGSGGFGYDPIFIPQGYNDTFAELDPQLKNRISHRARALEAMRGYLQT